MYATIETGGKQLMVEVGKYYEMELLPEAVGEQVVFDEPLCVHDGKAFKLGQPCVKGARVLGEVLRHDKADKVKIIKFRRRQHSMIKTGHRQKLAVVKITAIETKAAAKKKTPAKVEE